jgi:hypothetical protein
MSSTIVLHMLQCIPWLVLCSLCCFPACSAFSTVSWGTTNPEDTAGCLHSRYDSQQGFAVTTERHNSLHHVAHLHIVGSEAVRLLRG